MKKVQYVEAMVDANQVKNADLVDCDGDGAWEPENRDSVALAVKVLRELTIETPTEQWLEAVREIGTAWDALDDEIQKHECDCDHACEPSPVPDDPIPFAPLGGVVSIRREIDRHWLPGDELAILKLSDLRELLGERERNDQLCYYVAEEAS